MKFYPLTETVIENSRLEQEYKSARQIGGIRLGDTCLLFKSKLKNYYIPYNEVKSCFRRIVGVNIKMCCGKGEAQELMKELKVRMPEADFSVRKNPEALTEEVAQGAGA